MMKTRNVLTLVLLVAFVGCESKTNLPIVGLTDAEKQRQQELLNELDLSHLDKYEGMKASEFSELLKLADYYEVARGGSQTYRFYLDGGGNDDGSDRSVTIMVNEGCILQCHLSIAVL